MRSEQTRGVINYFFAKAKGLLSPVFLSAVVLFSILFSHNVSSAVTISSFVSSDVGISSVRLNATISASTDSTRLHFAFGTSSANLALSTPEKLLPSSNITIETSQFISGLQCGTTYYYRVVANNGGNETLSSSDSFTTLDCVSIMAVIDTRDATNITLSSARLNGNLSLDNTYFEVKYYFEYGPNTAYGERTNGDIVGQNVLQADVDDDVFDLRCGITYHYRLVVALKETVNSDPVLNEGNDLALATIDCPPPELFPASTVATGTDNATVSVALNTYGRKVDVFFQWGSTSDLGEQTEAQRVESGTVLEQISGLGCGTPYYYVAVMQYDSNEVLGELKTFNTKVCSQPPTATTRPATDILKNSASISASVAPNEATTSAYFEWGVEGFYDLTTEAVSITAGFSGQIVRVDLTDLECATKYFYRIFASNINGEDRGQGLSFTTSSCEGSDPEPEPEPDLLSANVFAGKNHSIILGKSGEVITWGDNRFFQLGGATSDVNLVDGVKLADPKPGLPSFFFNVKDAAVGGEHSLLLHDEEILSFGNNNVGQLGAFSNNLPAQEPLWVGVFGKDDAAVTDIIDIDAGNKHSIALRNDGGILLWGDNSFGQLAVDQLPKSERPILMTNVNNAIQVAAGDNFNLAVLQDKTLVAWGANDSGQLGVGSNSQKADVSIVLGADNIKSLSVGAEHVLALRENNSVLVWGNNQSGQLGIGNTDNQESPVPLDFVGANVVQLAAGGKHSVVLLEDGTMLAWGDNSFGQLGIVSSESVMSPTKVVDAAQGDLSGIVSIAAGENYTIAVDNKGNILSWGDNSLGQLNGKISTDTDKVLLTDKFDVNISLNMPRIIVDTASLSIERGSSSNVKVRLSANPDEVVAVTAEFDSGTDDFFIERDNRVFFSPERVDWPIEKPLTITSIPDSNAMSGILSFSAPGFATVQVEVKILGGTTEKPKEQVVGALPPAFILFLLSWLVVTSRYRFK